MFNIKLYARDFLGTIGIYTLTVFASVRVLKRFELEGALKLIVALTPMIPAIVATFVAIHHLKKLDEMQLKILVEAFTAAALITGLFTFSLAFAEKAGVPQLPLVWVLPMMTVLWVFLIYIFRARYLGK